MNLDELDDDLAQPAPRRPKRKKKRPSSKSGERGSAGKKSRKRKGQKAESSKDMSQAQIYTLVACIVIPLLGIATFMAIRQHQNEAAEEAAFAAVMDELLKPPGEGTPPEGKPGRFAEIDVDKRAQYSPIGIQSALEPDMRARTPDEADYIVHVHEIRETVSEYTDGTKGIKLTLEVTVIDKDTWTVMGRKTFVGEDPPTLAFGDDDVVGELDRDEVKAFYRSLAGMD
jgi:hypothetical protein